MKEEAWLEWAVRLQALAQNGLAYDPAVFDRERYEEIRDIASQMMSAASGIPKSVVTELFASEDGYQTPKIDTRAAIFQEDKILLVQEANGMGSGHYREVGVTYKSLSYLTPLRKLRKRQALM